MLLFRQNIWFSDLLLIIYQTLQAYSIKDTAPEKYKSFMRFS